MPPTEEHGRGLKIIGAVVDNVRLIGNDGHGTTVHFEKALDWVPGTPGQHLFSADSGGGRQIGRYRARRGADQELHRTARRSSLPPGWAGCAPRAADGRRRDDLAAARDD